MIDSLFLKNETKYAIGYKNYFYKVILYHSKQLNDIYYSFGDWKNKIDLINPNRTASTKIYNKNEGKGVEIMFDRYENLSSFVRKYNLIFSTGETKICIKVIYKRQTLQNTLTLFLK
jgi:hypothetical protein